MPVTPEQIAESGIAAARAGATIVHIHVRDPADRARARARSRSTARSSSGSGPATSTSSSTRPPGMGGDLMLDPQNPTHVRRGHRPGQRRRAARARRGAAARHLHARLRQPQLRRGQPGLRQHPGHAARGRQAHPGARRALRDGDLRHRAPVVRQPARRGGPDRRPGDVPALHGHPVRRARRPGPAGGDGRPAARGRACGRRSRSAGCRCRGWRSRCCSAGTCGSAWRTTSTSAAGVKATNAQLVERARTIVEAMGAEVATPDEAREILRLKPRS